MMTNPPLRREMRSYRPDASGRTGDSDALPCRPGLHVEGEILAGSEAGVAMDRADSNT